MTVFLCCALTTSYLRIDEVSLCISPLCVWVSLPAFPPLFCPGGVSVSLQCIDCMISDQ